MKALDLTGQKFGKLTASEVTKIRNVRSWICKCECGGEVVVPTFQLTAGNRTKCDNCSTLSFKEGDVFGSLTVVEIIRTRNVSKRPKARCNCECGNEKIVTARNLTRGSATHCGCKTKENLSKAMRKEYGESLRKRVISTYKSNAKNRGYEFNLTEDMMNDLFKGNCYYCGCEPSKTVTKEGFYGSFTYNGIDRLNNKVGYVPSNVVSCCHVCNYLKNKYDVDEFLELIKRIAQHHKLCD